VGPAAGLTAPPSDDACLLEDASMSHPLVRAVASGDVGALEAAMASNPVNVNGLTTDDAKGVTLLHVATQADQSEVIKFLCGRGAHVDARDARGRTPLMYAAWHKAGSKTIEALLLAGADVNARTPKGYSVFHVALRAGSSSTISRIRRACPDVNTASVEGITPLHDMVRLPPSTAVSLVDAYLRCRQVDPQTRKCVIPRSRTDATETAGVLASVRQSLGTGFNLRPASLARTPLRCAAYDREHDAYETAAHRHSSAAASALARQSESLKADLRAVSHAMHEDDDGASAATVSPAAGHPPGDGVFPSTVPAESSSVAQLFNPGLDAAPRRALFGSTDVSPLSSPGRSPCRTPPPPPLDRSLDRSVDTLPPPPPDSAPPPNAIDATPEAPSTVVQPPASPGGEAEEDPDVVCGKCLRIFGTCGCVLSDSPCYTPGRWHCPTIDSKTPFGETTTELAASQGIEHSRVVAMLVTYTAHSALEDLVA
jgi:hypothetical protein